MARQTSVGTSLANLEVDVWRGQRNEHFLASTRSGFGRMYFGTLAFYSVVAGIMLLAGHWGWRLAGVVMVGLAHSTFHVCLLRWTTTADRVERALGIVNVALLGLMAALIFFTGGLASPLIVSLPVLIVPSALMLGLGRATRLCALWTATFLILLFAVPPELIGPALPEPYRDLLTIIATVWAMLAIFVFTRRVSNATRAASDALGYLREERLSMAIGQLRRLQSVGAKVAHELKNPLAAVKGLVQLVARAPEGERSRERLDVVQAEISRMEMILHEYLSFARPLEDLSPQPVDVAEVVEDVAAVLAGRAEQGKVALAVTGPSVRLQADPRRLKEALLNVIANAIEFTPTGGRVEVDVAPHEGGARITVRDTGRGIAADDLARVGTSFFTTREAGTGLGVVLAKNVVTQHGGSFHLASKQGHGTIVTIQLPAAPPSSSKAPDTGREAEHGTGLAGRR